MGILDGIVAAIGAAIGWIAKKVELEIDVTYGEDDGDPPTGNPSGTDVKKARRYGDE